MENITNIKYEQKVVAFLDVLGFRNLVLLNKINPINTINHINEAISHTVNIFKSEGPESVSIKLFSDCFCISSDPSDLILMVRELSFLQLSLATHNIFVRGAISAGAHFENDTIIFSEGLINAYEFQSQNKFPRIITDEKITNRMKAEESPYSSDELVEYLAIAPDGLFFLDYLQFLQQEETGGFMNELMEDHKKAIMKEISENKENHNIIEKYRWLSQYHNSKFFQFYDPDDYFEEYKKEILEKFFIPEDAFPPFKMGSLDFSSAPIKKW